jgi:hypothetical protein
VGKSSLVKAGMIPAIRRGWIEEQRGYDPRGWLIAVMRPGSDPVFNLAEALARTFPEGMSLNALRRELDTQDPESLRALVRQHTPAKSRFLLVVDQLEELFTLVADEQAQRRRDFDALLAGAVDDPDGSFHLITTIRSDFTLRLISELPRLAEYYLARYESHSSENLVNAFRLMGLAELRPHLTEPALRSRVEEAIAQLDALLRARQVDDGGWNRRGDSGAGDPLTSAWVGLALDYENPPLTDPVVTDNIEFLLDMYQVTREWAHLAEARSMARLLEAFAVDVAAYYERLRERLDAIPDQERPEDRMFN